MSNTRQSAIPTAGATGSPRQLSVLIAGHHPCGEPFADDLRAAGYAVTTCPPDADPSAAGRESRPDAVLFGLPPDASGDWPAVVAALHDQAGWRKPLVVVLTAAASPGESRLAREAGVHLYAEHPPDPAVLVAVLRRFHAMLADIEGFDPVI